MAERTDRFDVVVRPAALPAESQEERERFDALNAHNEKLIQPRIDAHLAASRDALDDLRMMHRAVAEETDLDLAGDTRQAAGWQVSGRILSLLEAALTLAQAGFASELAPILRSVHEGNHLLRALVSHPDASILQNWLAGHHVKPSRVLKSEARFQKAVAAEMRAAGIEPPPAVTRDLAALYEFLSEMTHLRRGRVAEIVGVEQRIMPIGRHPDARLRGLFVYYATVYTMDSVGAVGFSLGMIFGGWAVERTQARFQLLNRLMQQFPLDPEAVRGH